MDGIHVVSVDVLLKPAGNAPILKKKKWTVDREKRMGWISEFIRKIICRETEDSLVSLRDDNVQLDWYTGYIVIH